MSKEFIFNQLVDRENICNLKTEAKIILEHIKAKKSLILYAPRNYGKTSLIKNIIIPDFQKAHKKHFVFFVDLIDVKNFNSISLRIKKSFEHAFIKAFPLKNITQIISSYLTNLQPQFEIDPITNKTSISISSLSSDSSLDINQIFETIKNISRKNKVLLIFDEFQDIAFIPEAQGIFRQIFEQLKDIPIIIMGSKNHILSNIFSSPNKPLAFWGNDLQIKPIDYDKYHQYILERFQSKSLNINRENCIFLQDIMKRIPEPINMLCYQIKTMYQGIDINKEHIGFAIDKLLENKEARYESYLGRFTSNEESLLINIAKHEPVKMPLGKEFVALMNLTPRSISKILNKCLDNGIIESSSSGYRIIDPLLHLYLRLYR